VQAEFGAPGGNDEELARGGDAASLICIAVESLTALLPEVH
jgi:hypothetical protein